MRKQYLTKKAVRELIASISSTELYDKEFIAELRNSDTVYIVEQPRFRIYVFDSTPALFEHVKIPNHILPTLFAVNTFMNSKGRPPIPWIRVDEGAVNPILRGADVMIPGVKEASDFPANAPLCVLEPNKRYAIGVGVALVPSTEISPGKRGKCMKVVSRLNDDIWNLCLEIARKSR
ncbi:MAG: RNA-binding protein [Crenarchaeota archaeon]|nr:RNA-binding protein [Thermoproteota archaeon]